MQIRVALIGAALSLLCLDPGAVLAQGGGSRSAAAEAYDRGTGAYLDGSYEKAAQWFETANRLAPAAPALMQAVRAHDKAGNTLKAASLALQLKREYAAEPAAVKFADTILEANASQYVQVQVQCDGCSLEVDDGVQEYPVFFVEAGVGHNIAATFPTGTVSEEVTGNAGDTRELAFEAPPAPPPVIDDPTIVPPPVTPATQDPGGKGMTPVVFFVGAGVTVGLAVGAIVMGLGTNSAVEDFDNAADASNKCGEGLETGDCTQTEYDELYEEADSLLDTAKGKRTTTTVLWVATGVVAAATATIGIFFTDWKGKGDAKKASLDFDLAPLRGGAFATLKGRF
jgi:hypothetical protein